MQTVTIEMSEKEIFKNIKKGNLKDFEIIFRDFYSQLCYYALRFVGDYDEAEEVVQDIFYQLWKNRKQLKVHTSLKAYLYRAVYNNCLQHIRQKGQESKYEDYLKNQENTGNSPFENLNEKEMIEIVQDTLETLPERSSQIFKMSRFEGLKYQEIADKLSISIKTVEANMGKALKAFRESLKDYC